MAPARPRGCLRWMPISSWMSPNSAGSSNPPNSSTYNSGSKMKTMSQEYQRFTNGMKGRTP